MATNKRKKKRVVRYFSKTEAVQKPNPFDLKVNHKKYSYVGRQTKGQSGKPTESRSKAILRRTNRISNQITSKERSNKFKDSRLGEKTSDLSEEQRSLLRLQAYKCDEATKAIQPDCDLTTRHIFVNPEEEDDESNELMETLLSEMPPDSDKLQEVILKAKLARAERVREKCDLDETTTKMNSDWESMRTYLKFRTDAANFRKAPPDEYDSFFQSLKFTPQTQYQSKQRTMDFEDKAEYITRMEKQLSGRMHPPQHICNYVSPDDLTFNDDQESVKKIPSKDLTRPMFLTELSHVTDIISDTPIPESFDLFKQEISSSDGRLSEMLVFCNPLRNSGDRRYLQCFIDYTWQAVLNIDMFDCLLQLMQTVQTLVYHYPDEIEPLIIEYLSPESPQFQQSSSQCKNAILCLISRVYSVTDYKHKFGNLGLSCGSEHLRNVQCTSLDECKHALNTCLILSEYVEVPQRIVPEILSCLHKMLLYLSDFGHCSDCNDNTIDLTKFCECKVLLSALLTLKRHVKIVRNVQRSAHLIESFHSMLDRINLHRDVILEIQNEIKNEMIQSRQKRKLPEMIAMKSPRLKSRFCRLAKESVFDKRMKLRRKFKKDMRCTAREIKKESQVLSELKFKKQKSLDVERNEKVKRIMFDLANQEGDCRKAARTNCKFEQKQ